MKSLPVDVNLTNSTYLAQHAQDTANSATGGVSDLNDPNQMSVIEKQQASYTLDVTTARYNALLAEAKYDGINTDTLESAYTALSTYMQSFMGDLSVGSEIDRDRYTALQSAYNSAYASMQSAVNASYDKTMADSVKDIADAKRAISAGDAKIASGVAAGLLMSSAAESAGNQADTALASAGQAIQSTASNAASLASQAESLKSTQAKTDKVSQDLLGAKSSIASNANRLESQAESLESTQAKADKTADDLLDAKASIATNAANNTKTNGALSAANVKLASASTELVAQASATGKAQSQADTALTKATTGITTANQAIANDKVTSQAVTALKGGSTKTVAELANGLETKVESADYKTEVAQLDKAIGTKVESADYNSKVTQIDKAIDSKVDSAKYSSDKIQSDNLIGQKVNSADFKTYQTQTDKLISQKVDSGTYSSDKTQTAGLIAQKVSQKDFDDLQVGSRNYILDSNQFLTTNNNQKGFVSSVPLSTFDGQKIVVSVSVHVKNITALSGNMRIGTESVIHEVDTDDNKLVLYAGAWKKFVTADVGSSFDARIWQTFSLVGKHVTDTSRSFGWIYIQGIEADEISVGQPMYSIGNKVTDYSPAPEDMATESEITQTNSQIQTLIQSKDNLVLKPWFDDNDVGSWGVGTSIYSSPNIATANGHANLLKFTLRDTNEADNLITVSKGEHYYFEAWISTLQANVSVAFGFHFVKQDGTSTWLSAIRVPAGTGIAKYNGSLEVPATAVTASPWIGLNGYSDVGIGFANGLRITKNPGATQITQLSDQINAKVSNATYKSDQTQLAGEIAAKVATSNYTSDKTQTEKEIAAKVATTDFKSYQTQTATALSQLVLNKDFSAYKTQTASLIGSKVATSDFSTYKTQTATAIGSKVSSSTYSSDQTQLKNLIAAKVDSGTYSSDKTQTAGLISSKVSQNDFDNMQIGGTNQIKHDYIKAFASTLNSYDPATDVFTITLPFPLGKYGSGIGRKHEPNKLIPWNSYYTYSVEVFVSDEGLKWTSDPNIYPVGVSAWRSNDNDNQKQRVLSLTKNGSVLVPNKWTKIWVTVVNNDPLNVTKADVFDSGSNFTIKGTTKETVVKFRHYKGELGSKPTDYSPAPEDQATQSDITQLSDSISAKVSTGDFNTYKTQTASLIGSKVATTDFSTYKTQTATAIGSKVSSSTYSSDQTQLKNLIAAKVDSGTYSTNKTQTDKLISSKVATTDFNTYQSQTATAIAAKVANGDFSTYKTQTANLINSKVASSTYNSDKTQTAKLIATKVSQGDIANPNLIPNSGLPKDTTGWQYGSYSGSSGSLVVATHPFYHNSADRMFELTNSGTGENYAYSSSFNLKRNTTYTLSFVGFASSNVSSMDVFLLAKPFGETKGYTVAYKPINTKKLSASGVEKVTFTFKTNEVDTGYLRFDNNSSTNGQVGVLFFSEVKLEEGSIATQWVYDGSSSMITQLSDDISLKVDAKGVINSINISPEGNLINGNRTHITGATTIDDASITSAAIKSLSADKISGGTITATVSLNSPKITGGKIDGTDITGTYLHGKNTIDAPTITGGTIGGTTVTGTTINGGTINSPEFRGGPLTSNSGAKFYPLLIGGDGSLYAKSFKKMGTVTSGMEVTLKDGMVSTSTREITPFAPNKYYVYGSEMGYGHLFLSEGYTATADPNFTADMAGDLGSVELDATEGLTLQGDNQWVRFTGQTTDKTPKGISLTSYGNLNATGTQGTWYLGYDNDNQTANFGIDLAKNNDIYLNRTTRVSHIIANASKDLFLEDANKMAAFHVSNDGKGQIWSPTIYNRTYSGSANIQVTSYGTLGRVTSATKYKLDITHDSDTLMADRLMTVDPANWFDKFAVESVAKSMSDGSDLTEAEMNVKQYSGLIAEDLHKAGLDRYLSYGADGAIEGIQYDRLWTVLIPKVRQLQNEINDLKMKVARK